jgi:hypothetical protein
MYINICMDTDQSNELIAKACQKRLSLATGEIIGQHQLSHDCHRAAMQIDDLVIATQTDLSLFGFPPSFCMRASAFSTYTYACWPGAAATASLNHPKNAVTTQPHSAHSCDFTATFFGSSHEAGLDPAPPTPNVHAEGQNSYNPRLYLYVNNRTCACHVFVFLAKS